MPALGRKTLKSILEVLRIAPASGVATHERLATLAAEVSRALSPRRGTSERRKAVKSKKAAKNAETASIREAVFARAGRTCECGCGSALSMVTGGDLDHFFGRKVRQSVYTTWALNRLHHHQKTNNEPSAAEWLRKFIAHCQRHLEASDGGSDEFFKWAGVVIEAEKRLAFVEQRKAFA